MRIRSVCGFQATMSIITPSYKFVKPRFLASVPGCVSTKKRRAAGGRDFFPRQGYARPGGLGFARWAKTQEARSRGKTRPRRGAAGERLGGASFREERRGRRRYGLWSGFRLARPGEFTEPGKRQRNRDGDQRERPGRTKRNRDDPQAEDTRGQ